MKKVALLSMVLVLLLAAVGVGYAKWSKDITIDGYIQTGEVAIGICDAWCVEWPEAEGKDVGWCDVFYEEGGQILEIQMFNTYPCYGCDVYYLINNLGSIPVKVEAINLTKVSVNGMDIPVDMPLTVCHVYGVQIDEVTGDVIVDDLGPAGAIPPEILELYDFDIHVTGEFGQIDPVGSPFGPDTVEGDLHIHVDQAAEMNTTYDFQIQIIASQWNEVP
jgi:hypothetical protein